MTPMMQQYSVLKNQYQDFLLFYRMGDFYELFNDDAISASQVLNITLTQRRSSKEQTGVPMCGVPFHAAEGYIAKLLTNGFKVALCEQTETPEQAKKAGRKLVNREVVRLYTSGTLTEDSMLPEKQHNYLAAIHTLGGEMALGWLELSTGEFATTTITKNTITAELGRLNPSEIIAQDDFVATYGKELSSWQDKITSPFSNLFDSRNSTNTLKKHLSVNTLDGFGFQNRAQMVVCGALIDYIDQTQKTSPEALLTPRIMVDNSYMHIDPATRSNLELTETLRGAKKGSLLHSVDKTTTAAGARMLSSWLTAPLTNLNAINKRHNGIAAFIDNPEIRNNLRDALKHIPDLNRALARITLNRGGPRDLAAIKQGLQKLPDFISYLEKIKSVEIIADITKGLDNHHNLATLLEKALADNDLPLLARDGGFIRDGYCPELDKHRSLNNNGLNLLQTLERQEAENIGISSLKIRYNKVWGYYVEVTKAHADKIPSHYIHRQTTTQCQRFTTPELIEIEKDLSSAGVRAAERELEIYNELTTAISNWHAPLLLCADSLAKLDVLTAGAKLATTHNYTRPKMTDSRCFTITAGRHPVVETTVDTFIPNNCELSNNALWLLTGPNMAGKSTFLRQNALITILAHTGFYVPAKEATIGLVDRVFTRIGAADDLARGQSTFMVEMVETANILNNATDKSLVILDEIGRGTATYDGLSIAWACVEHLAQQSHCRTLFATHYHELTQLADNIKSITCHHVAVREWNNDIVFLHEVKAGTSPRSYGIHVGKLAGLPTSVTMRAEQVLAGLEDNPTTSQQIPLFNTTPITTETTSKLPAFIEGINPDALTPKEALNIIYEIKELN